MSDQYFFVNKTASSQSLSRSVSDERFFIHSYVHGKFYKDKKESKKRSPVNKSGTSSPFVRSASVSDSSQHGKVRESSAATPLASRQKNSAVQRTPPETPKGPRLWMVYDFIGSDSIDPFCSTSSTIDEMEHRFLHYTYRFIEESFNAESLCLVPRPVAKGTFRHHGAVRERYQRCVVDQLVMYAILAFASSCVKNWADGQEIERPPEMYIIKAINTLNSRLGKSSQDHHSLILPIYALAVAEMWSANYDAAASHMRIIRHFVSELGGFGKLDNYLMESLLLCDKYIALGKFAPPILPLEWDPKPMLPREGQLDFQQQTRFSMPSLGEGFFELDPQTLGPDLLMIVRDMIGCVQVACSMEQQADATQEDQRWLFLRHQAINHRLLSLHTDNALEECCKIALLIWLLRLVAYCGGLRWSKRLLPRLKSALMQLDDSGAWTVSPLLFWIVGLGAMTAEQTEKRYWFVSQVASVGAALGIPAERESYREVLEKYLLLKSECGTQFEKMILAARESKSPDYLMNMGMELAGPSS